MEFVWFWTNFAGKKKQKRSREYVDVRILNLNELHSNTNIWVKRKRLHKFVIVYLVPGRICEKG